MAIPIINDWEKFYSNPHEGLGSSYERIVINQKLNETVDKYNVKTALESPAFGFTGISGINLFGLADSGIQITLEDNDAQRLKLIENLWNTLQCPLKAALNEDFRYLKYPDKSFDLSFSFSALWFVPELKDFLEELSRVTAKVIFLSVPNRNGLGYKMQIKDYNKEKYPFLKLENIDPPSIISILKGLGWKLREADYFDCPPWPDIGMTKEELLYKWFPSCPLRKRFFKPKLRQEKVISIIDYYSGKDPGFAERMKSYQWLEKLAPRMIKRVWAHHYYMVFDRN